MTILLVFLFGVGFSECLFSGRLKECVQQEASVSQSVVPLLNLDGKSGDEVESLLVVKCPLELTLTPMEISFNNAKLNSSDRQSSDTKGQLNVCDVQHVKRVTPAATGHLVSRQTENASMRGCSWTRVTGSTGMETGTGSSWQLIGTLTTRWLHHVPAP